MTTFTMLGTNFISLVNNLAFKCVSLILDMARKNCFYLLIKPIISNIINHNLISHNFCVAFQFNLDRKLSYVKFMNLKFMNP